MELKNYFSILKKQWRLILMVTLVIGVLATVASAFISPSYHAQVRLRVATPVGGSLGDVYYQTTFAARLMNTYVQVATSEQIMSDLKEKLGLKSLPTINVRIVPDSEVIQIDVEDNDPVQAAKVANGLADLLITKSQFNAVENETDSGNVKILTSRRDEIEKNLSEARKEHDRLVELYSLTTAKISVLDRTIRLKESSYTTLEMRYQEALIADVVVTTSRSRATLDALNQEMNRVNEEIQTLNKEYETLLKASNEYMQQITMIRQIVVSDQSTYSDLLYRIDSYMVANSQQENSQGMIIISPAVEAINPSGISRMFVIVLGWMCGLFAGIIVGFMRDNLGQLT